VVQKSFPGAYWVSKGGGTALSGFAENRVIHQSSLVSVGAASNSWLQEGAAHGRFGRPAVLIVVGGAGFLHLMVRVLVRAIQAFLRAGAGRL